MHELNGACHCGNLTLSYHTGVAPEAAAPRACQCTFCRKHQARAVSDPRGRLRIVVAAPDDLSRYRFGTGNAEFLICRRCGVYVAAFMADPDDAHGYATLMVSALDAHARYPVATPTVYDGEDLPARGARRRRVWTPAELCIAGPEAGA